MSSISHCAQCETFARALEQAEVERVAQRVAKICLVEAIGEILEDVDPQTREHLETAMEAARSVTEPTYTEASEPEAGT